MLRIGHIISFFVFCSFALSAQQGVIKGIVTDKLNNEAIQYASVRLFQYADTTYVSGSASNEKGAFSLSVKTGQYLLEVSFLGYKSNKRMVSITTIEPNFDVGIIRLANDSLTLDEAVVVAKVPDVVIKGDTIEYNAEAYITDENALLEDIVKKMPGVEMDVNGNLTANGKPITKILVDGKEFFDNDIKLALQNLPANMIKKLQLFKEQSETSKITGFKDNNENQVLNLKIKDEYKRNLFGDARLGYGSDNRYSNRLMANYMHDDNQFSALGSMDNANSDSGYGGYMSGASSIDKNKNAGFNLNIKQSEKLKIGANIRYSDNSNLYQSQSQTEYFEPSRISIGNSSNNSNKKNLNVGTYLEWKPDSLTSVYLRLSGSQNRSANNRFSDNKQYATEKDTTQSRTDYSSTGEGYQANTSLVVGRKLNSKGRNISFSFNGGFRNDDSDASNLSKTNYSSGATSQLIDQRQNTDNKSRNWGLGFNYVEPLSSHNSIMLSYSYRQNTTNRDRNTFTKDTLTGNYTVLDRNYTRHSQNFYSNHNINFSFQSLHENYDYSIGFSVDPSYSRSKVSVVDSIIDFQKQSVVNFSPTLRFSYKPKKDQSINISYSGSTSHPGISQLSTDTIRNSSGTSKTYGNKDLKMSYNNGINVYYNKSDFESGKFLMLSASFNYTFNKIANYTKVDTLWNTETTYRNVDGNWNTNIGATYSTPLKNKKFKLELNSYTYYSRNVGFTNTQRSITNNWNFSESVSLKFSADKIDTRLQLNYTYGLATNNIQNQSNRTTSDMGATSSTTLKLPFNFSIQNDIDFSYNSGYSSDFKKTQIRWNASISKQFLKGKKATLKAQFYDILKEQNNVTRTVSDNSISDMRTNSISRYFLVSFSYRFNFSKGKSKPQYDEYGDY